MTKKLRFGEFLTQRGVASPAEVLQALDYQNSQRKPFHKTAVDLGILSVKEAYSVYNHRAGTSETFEEAAVKLGSLTVEQVDQINQAIVADTKRLGEILVAMKVVTSREIISELREFKSLQREQEEYRSQVGGITLFAGCDGDALDALVGAARHMVCVEKQTIFNQGDPADRFWAVATGVVTLTATPDEEGGDAEPWTTYVHPSEVFGETALFAPDFLRPATAVADAGSELIGFERGLVHSALANHQQEVSDILERLLTRILRRLDDAHVSLGVIGLS